MSNSKTNNSKTNNSNKSNSRSNDRPRDDRRGGNDRSRGNGGSSKMKICYHISRRENQDKAYWTRIGVAFENSDGSLNVKLDVLPINGEVHIRDYVPFDGDNGDNDDEQEDE